MKRTIIGMLAAPLVPSIVFIDNAGIVLSFIMSYIVAFVFGIPAVIVLNKAIRGQQSNKGSKAIRRAKQ